MPAGLLHIWPRSEPALWHALTEHLAESVGPDAGVHPVHRGLLAVLPTGNDPAVLDTAVSYGRFLLAAARRPRSGGGAEAAMLASPGQVRLQRGRLTIEPDHLFENLVSSPPDLQSGDVHLTGRALRSLEIQREGEPTDPLIGATGRSVPIFRLGHVHKTHRLWRNPAPVGRRVRAAPRPRIEESLREALRSPVLRVQGAMGVGKTRAVLEALDPDARRILRVVVPAARSAVPPLAAQLARGLLQLADADERTELVALINRLTDVRRQELTGRSPDHGEFTADSIAQLLRRAATGRAKSGGLPLTLICDDLERASEPEIAQLHELATGCDPATFQLVLIGRNQVPWPEDIATVDIGTFESEEMAGLGANLFSGLSLPEVVQHRLLAASGGNPFVLEEGLAALIHGKKLRQIYGSFFFSGDDDVGFQPSARLIGHVESELRSHGHALPMRLLAAANVPVSGPELRSAASLLNPSEAGDAAWHKPLLGNGWLANGDSPWGKGLAYTAVGIQQAVAATVGDPQTYRHAVGELLVELSSDDSARWQAYHLIAGSPEAVPVLLRVARSRNVDGADRPAQDEHLLAALTHEVVAHRERNGDSETELKLLMALLPIALNTANLEGLAGELKHAMHLALQQSVSGPEQILALARLKADLDRREGRLDKAEETLRSALKSSRTADEAGKAALLLQLGRVLMEQQRYEEAEGLLEKVLEPIERPGFEALSATCRFYLGNIALRQNRFEGAGEHHRRALEQRLARPKIEQGKPTIASLTALGAVCLAMGRYSESLEHYQEAERRARELGDKLELPFALLGLGEVLGRLGDFAAASSPLRHALVMREQSGDDLGEALARLAVARNHLDLDRPQDALREAREAHFRISLLPETPFNGEANRLLGRIQLHRRHTAEAREHLLKALQFHLNQRDEVAAAFDRSWLLEAALVEERADVLTLLVSELKSFLDQHIYPEQGERLDYRVYRGLDWLHQRQQGTESPLPFLERAYEALLRKAGRIEPEVRQHFLYQIPENQEILVAATKNGITG
ncbi:MAG: tetratricopeptide repeat protein [Acidobacteriota bacterium]